MSKHWLLNARKLITKVFNTYKIKVYKEIRELLQLLEFYFAFYVAQLSW